MSTKIGEIELLKPLAVGTMAWGRTWLDNKLNRGARPLGGGGDGGDGGGCADGGLKH